MFFRYLLTLAAAAREFSPWMGCRVVNLIWAGGGAGEVGLCGTWVGG